MKDYKVGRVNQDQPKTLKFMSLRGKYKGGKEMGPQGLEPWTHGL